MQVLASTDGSEPRIGWEYQTACISMLKKELKDESEICFIHLAAKFALGRITLDEYLDGVLAHLRKSSQAKHKFDVLSMELWPENDLWPLTTSDIFAGSVRALMWSPSFTPFEDKEWKCLRALASLAWNLDDPDEFQTRAREEGLDPSSLSPEAADLLLVICYCRRHVKLLEHLVHTVQPPAESSFDRLPFYAIEARTDSWSNTAQHSPKSPENVTIEIQIWTLLLNSSWIHNPVDENVAAAMTSLGHTRAGSDPWAIEYTSPALSEFHSTLVAREFFPSLSQVASFILSCPDVEIGRRYFKKMPGSMISSHRFFYPSHTGGLLVPIIESKTLSDQHRLDLVRLVLEEIPRLDLDARIDRPWVADMRSFGAPGDPWDFFNPLMAAGWRGDKKMAELLLEHGAKPEVKDCLSNLDAGGLARQQGHKKFARWFEGRQAS
ncbi:hypothetical protein NCS57_00530300 [Fusarium keratoplasticum]|uniref:Uncharacterized protein n=1 Tax=Fusarium keratoplasticum TaxID=1328300 RepID=A0ACC0R0S1_9HYPO|nr:hypothetical protein NCS57_00530300 [Fusarium keratoplasticum]KAI8670585.1 hypothetical protein NCS57_00530300 [Fusarium keratoplasticum]